MIDVRYNDVSGLIEIDDGVRCQCERPSAAVELRDKLTLALFDYVACTGKPLNVKEPAP